MIAVNLNGPFIYSQACAPVMRNGGGGSIVNIGSISGLRTSTLRVAYGTSKAALMHLTKQQAAELGNLGIRVNAAAPGPVDTAMAKQVHTPDIRSGYHDAIPLNRYGLEEEIASAVWYLCSEAASYVNGQTLAVDGGFDATGIGLPSLRADETQHAACGALRTVPNHTRHRSDCAPLSGSMQRLSPVYADVRTRSGNLRFLRARAPRPS